MNFPHPLNVTPDTYIWNEMKNINFISYEKLRIVQIYIFVNRCDFLKMWGGEKGCSLNCYLVKQQIQEFDLSVENLGSWTSEFTRVTPSKPNQF